MRDRIGKVARMEKRDIKPLEVLDQATTLVETESLRSQRVNNLRILSESRFLDIVRHLVEEYLDDAFKPENVPGAGDSRVPHDQKLAREYERRWQSLRTKHEIGLRQIERRMDRLSRVFRRLENLMKKADEPRAAAVEAQSAPDTDAPQTRVDKKSLMREMLLGADRREAGQEVR